MTENEMVGWHHRLNGHEFEQTQGDDEGQGSPGSQRVRHNSATEQQQPPPCLSFSLFQVVNKVSSPSFMLPVCCWSPFPSHQFSLEPLQ